LPLSIKSFAKSTPFLNIELQGGTPEENKNITIDILSGKDHSPKRNVVVLNAALAYAIISCI
jgi:anthranilate phosphoribosyltransferase